MVWDVHVQFNMEHFEPIARGHEIAMQLARNPKVVEALGDLASDEELRDSVAANPAAFVATRGISLPTGAVVTLRQYVQVWEIEITVEEGGYTFTNGFNSSRGFYHR